MADPCIYFKTELKDGRECFMIVAVYVGDTILASKDDEMLKSTAVGRKFCIGGGMAKEIF